MGTQTKESILRYPFAAGKARTPGSWGGMPAPRIFAIMDVRLGLLKSMAGMSFGMELRTGWRAH